MYSGRKVKLNFIYILIHWSLHTYLMVSPKLNSDAWNPEGTWQLFYPFFVSLLNQVLIKYLIQLFEMLF